MNRRHKPMAGPGPATIVHSTSTAVQISPTNDRRDGASRHLLGCLWLSPEEPARACGCIPAPGSPYCGLKWGCVDVVLLAENNNGGRTRAEGACGNIREQWRRLWATHSELQRAGVDGQVAFASVSECVRFRFCSLSLS